MKWTAVVTEIHSRACIPASIHIAGRPVSAVELSEIYKQNV